LTKKQKISYWQKSAKHDFEAAVALYEKAKYDWCLFMGHLVIEKMLKAFWVRDSKKDVPLIHNLLELVKGTKINLTEKQKEWLANVNSFNIRARYPDYKFDFYQLCTKEFASERFDEIKEFYQWLNSQLILKNASTNSSSD